MDRRSSARRARPGCDRHLRAYGGILRDYLGREWKSKLGIPIVNMPGCPVLPDNFMETLLYLLYQLAGRAPMIPLDAEGRPTWLFNATVHEGCDRGGYYEQADFATEYGSPKCIVKLGCWGPVVQCNVGKRGWMAGMGGCPNVAACASAARCPGSPTIHALHERATGRDHVVGGRRHVRPHGARAALFHAHVAQP